MGAVSKIQIKYGCNFVTACKTEGVCRFVTKHKKELQEILHHKGRRELETLFQLDNILDWEERIKFCRSGSYRYLCRLSNGKGPEEKTSALWNVPSRPRTPGFR